MPEALQRVAASRDEHKIYDLLVSCYQGQVVSLAIELGLFEYLDGRLSTVRRIENRFSLGARGGDALLACLLSLGLLRRIRGKIGLTALSKTYLLPGSPYQMRAHLLATSPLWPGIKDAVLHDRPLDPRRVAAWENGKSLPDAEDSAARMHALISAPARGLARRGHFGGVARLLDVAGGSGSVSIALARRYPRMKITLLELPGVCPAAGRRAARHGLRRRITIQAGDMFREPWPAGHDALLFSNVFHDWSMDQCRFLARRSFESLPSGGRIFLHEMLMNDVRDGPSTTALFSFWMLLTTRGRQFSALELRALLAGCGFRGVTVRPTFGYFSLVSAAKP